MSPVQVLNCDSQTGPAPSGPPQMRRACSGGDPPSRPHRSCRSTTSNATASCNGLVTIAGQDSVPTSKSGPSPTDPHHQLRHRGVP